MKHYRRDGALLAILAALLPLPAPIEAATPVTGPDQAQVAPPPGINCRCRANGRTYELGQRVCLPTPSGYRVAECRMVQNVTSWAVDEEDCSVSASLTLFQQGAAPTPYGAP